ncbi:MAG: CRISPR system precrRNA processing endoribonuclease RAMP protein Cas6 [Magnetococcales bacterium]|nr:CRISPR system precrRNA processing endoribonuclease RAMP protein Cas6 [Magnetococcales bacterium]
MTETWIPHQRLQLHFQAPEPIPLFGYKGSAFRGLFGRALRDLVCPDKSTPCSKCLLQQQCLYLTIYESPTQPHTETYRKGPNHTPHPFILTPPLSLEKELPPHETFSAELILMGSALKALPHLVLACAKMGQLGLGYHRVRFQLHQVTLLVGESSHTLYELQENRLQPVNKISDFPKPSCAPQPLPSPVILEALTPLRFKSRGKYVTTFSFESFFRSLLFRLDDLSRLYGHGPLPAEIPQLIQQAKQIQSCHEGMRWVEYRRYSSRQKKYLILGGLFGTASFDGDLTPFTPWLRLGEILHTGKATGFGFGKYRLLSTPTPPSSGS